MSEVTMDLLEALKDSEDELKSIVGSVEGAYPEGENRSMSLVSSGFALGWGRREGHTSPKLPQDPAMALLRETVAELDTLILSIEGRENLADLRNRASSYLMQQKEAAIKRIRDGLEAAYGPTVADLVSRRGPYTEEEQFTIGHMVSSVSLQAFFGFCKFKDDSTIKCRCPFHLSVAMQERGVSRADAEKAVLLAFPSTYAALCAFGDWFAKDAASKVIDAEVGTQDDLHPMDPDAAMKESQGFLTRLLRPSGDAS